MISTRILDNDMGAVAKVPLTGRGTVHGITVIVDAITVPEIDMGIVEMIGADKGITRFTQHAEAHVSDPEQRKLVIQEYTKYVTAIHKSGQGRY